MLDELVTAELDDETVCAVEEFFKLELNDDSGLDDDVDPSLVCEVDNASAMLDELVKAESDWEIVVLNGAELANDTVEMPEVLDEVAVKTGPVTTLEETSAVRLNGEEEFEPGLVAELLEVVITEVFPNNAPSETLDESALVRSSALEKLAEE